MSKDETNKSVYKYIHWFTGWGGLHGDWGQPFCQKADLRNLEGDSENSEGLL